MWDGGDLQSYKNSNHVWGGWGYHHFLKNGCCHTNTATHSSANTAQCSEPWLIRSHNTLVEFLWSIATHDPHGFLPGCYGVGGAAHPPRRRAAFRMVDVRVINTYSRICTKHIMVEQCQQKVIFVCVCAIYPSGIQKGVSITMQLPLDKNKKMRSDNWHIVG